MNTKLTIAWTTLDHRLLQHCVVVVAEIERDESLERENEKGELWALKYIQKKEHKQVKLYPIIFGISSNFLALTQGKVGKDTLFSGKEMGRTDEYEKAFSDNP